jgi:chromosome segregation ATPase
MAQQSSGDPRDELERALAETTDRATGDVRRRVMDLELPLPATDAAARLILDVRFLLSELEYARRAANRKDEVIAELKDNEPSLSLAVRAAQATSEQQRTELDRLRAELEYQQSREARLRDVLAVAGGAVEDALVRHGDQAYSDAFEKIQAALAD